MSEYKGRIIVAAVFAGCAWALFFISLLYGSYFAAGIMALVFFLWSAITGTCVQKYKQQMEQEKVARVVLEWREKYDI